MGRKGKYSKESNKIQFIGDVADGDEINDYSYLKDRMIIIVEPEKNP